MQTSYSHLAISHTTQPFSTGDKPYKQAIPPGHNPYKLIESDDPIPSHTNKLFPPCHKPYKRIEADEPIPSYTNMLFSPGDKKYKLALPT